MSAASNIYPLLARLLPGRIAPEPGGQSQRHYAGIGMPAQRAVLGQGFSLVNRLDEAVDLQAVYADLRRQALESSVAALNDLGWIWLNGKYWRADTVLARVQSTGLGDVIAEQSFDRACYVAAHSERYVSFLESAWAEWTATGKTHDALPLVWPVRDLANQQVPDFIDGKLQPSNLPGQLDADKLSLVQNEDYEESLLVTNMSSRVKARCAQSLFALEQRLALLNNGKKLSEDSNPFGPQAIAQTFRDALTPTPFPLRIKTILYMLFDQHMMQNLDSLYEALNHRLIEAGVLPNLKYSAQRASSRPAPSSAPEPAPETPAEPTRATPAAAHSQAHTAPSPGQAGTASAAPATAAYQAVDPGDLSGPPSGDPAVLFSGLATLLSEHRQHDVDAPLLGGTRSIASFAPRDATRTYSANELLDALNRLQQQSANDLSQRLHKPQAVEGLKADLQQQLESHSSLPGQQKLSDQEADVIDLVGMLFDFILDDDNLPDNCKTALSHLHTPYLKVALQDKALFTQHHHPARRLLNSMAQAGVLYGGEGDERGLLAKMQWVVERVIHGFAGDLQLFESLLDEFNEYAATLQHKVELRERRAVEAAKGRDKLLGARQLAIDVVATALNERTPPAIIRNFLELTWADVLVFVLLRHGERSEEWQRASEVAEQLAWSGTPLDASGR